MGKTEEEIQVLDVSVNRPFKDASREPAGRQLLGLNKTKGKKVFDESAAEENTKNRWGCFCCGTLTYHFDQGSG